MKEQLQYVAPSVDVLSLSMETFTMTSGLEDYKDNPIFGAPEMGGGAPMV